MNALKPYRATLNASRRRTFERYQPADVAFKLVGTGSDPFLGYTRFGGHDYLVRQLADHKAGLAPTELKGRTLLAYPRLCGEVLAKGHARTGDAAVLAGYIGRSGKLDVAIATFAAAYADQTGSDYTLFVRSLRKRRWSIDAR